MALNSISSGSPQAVTSRLLQKMPPPGAGAGEPDDFSGILGDLMTLSANAPANKAAAAPAPPPAVGQAMSDLLSGQKDVQGDLGLLKGYFAQSPQTLDSLMGALKGTPGAEGGLEGAKPRERVDDRQAQAIAKYMAEAQRADARDSEASGASGIGVIALFG